MRRRFTKRYAPVYRKLEAETLGRTDIPDNVKVEHQTQIGGDLEQESDAFRVYFNKALELERYESSEIEQGRFGRMYALQDERDKARDDYYRQIDRTHQKRVEREEATEANPAVWEFRKQEAFKRRKAYVEDFHRDVGDLGPDEEHPDWMVNGTYKGWKHLRFYDNYGGDATAGNIDDSNSDNSYEDLGDF